MSKVSVDLIRREKAYLRADMAHLRASTSYKVGDLIAGSRGLVNLLCLPYRILKLMFTNKHEHMPMPRKGIDFVSSVRPGLHQVSGTIVSSANENPRIGAVAFHLSDSTKAPDDRITTESLGCSLSDTLGFYKYIHTDEKGDFTLDIAIPNNCSSLKWSVLPWGNKLPVFGRELTLSACDAELVSNCSPPETKKALAIYADLDINLIDGSAIWLISISEVIASIPDVSVDLYLKRMPQRDTLLGPILNHPSVRVLYREDADLEPFRVVHYISSEDAKRNYQYVIVRGLKAATVFADSERFDGRLCPYLTDLPHDVPNENESYRIDSIVGSAKFMLCQTPAIEEFLHSHAKTKPACIQMPPMIPRIDADDRDRAVQDGGLKIGYAGKFAQQWASEEMFSVFSAFREAYPAAELHIFGDKIHNEKTDAGFNGRVYKFLTSTEGVYWYRGLPRVEVMSRLSKLDVAWAWRHASLELSTRELSTKILEYGAAKLPALMFPNDINSELLGDDYELFVHTADDALEMLFEIAADKSVLSQPAERLHQKALPFSFSSATEKLTAALELDI